MLKRVSCIAVAIMMILAMACNITVAFADPAPVEAEAAFTVEKAERGDEVELDIGLKNYNASCGFRIQAEFDSTIYDFEDATVTNAVENDNVLFEANVVPGKLNTVYAVWASAGTFAVPADGIVLKIKCKIKDDVSFGSAAAMVTLLEVSQLGVAGGVPFSGELVTADIEIYCNHTFGVWTDAGDVHSRTCTKCGEVETEAHNAADAVTENETPASCTEPGGYDTVVYCSVCGKEMERTHHTIDAPGHTPGEPVEENVVPATCTEAGSHDVVVYCTVCHEELSRDHVDDPAPGHTPGEPVEENVVPATCTEAGSHDVVVYCTVCTAEISREAVVDKALGHDWGAWDPETGTRVCSRDPSHVDVCTHDEAFNNAAYGDEGAAVHTALEDTFICSICGMSKIVANPNPNPFEDVPDDAWYTEAVLWAVANNITSGTDATHFSPNMDCSRAQVVQFLYNRAGNPAPTTTVNPFEDVKETDWFYDAVLWAVENEITSGTDATHFSPTKVCTRAEVVMFLWNAEGNTPPQSTENPFTDVKSGDWFYESVLWAVENEITSGTTATTFSPAMKCTRAQIVMFLQNDALHE